MMKKKKNGKAPHRFDDKCRHSVRNLLFRRFKTLRRRLCTIIILSLMIWNALRLVNFYRHGDDVVVVEVNDILTSSSSSSSSSSLPLENFISNINVYNYSTTTAKLINNNNNRSSSNGHNDKNKNNINIINNGTISVMMKHDNDMKEQRYSKNNNIHTGNKISNNKNNYHYYWWEPYVEDTSCIYTKWDNLQTIQGIINQQQQLRNGTDDGISTSVAIATAETAETTSAVTSTTSTIPQYDWCHLEYKDEWDSEHYLQQDQPRAGVDVDISDDKNDDKSTMDMSGLMYVKSYKAASSTCEGINMAIAHHVAARKRRQRQNHQQQGQEQEQINRDKEEITTTAATMTTATIKMEREEKMICRHYNRHEFANYKLHEHRRRRKQYIPYGSAKRGNNRNDNNNGNNQETVPTLNDEVLSTTNKSLLWTFVRHPPSRDLSQVFHFRVSRQGIDPSSKNNNNNMDSISDAQHTILEALANQKLTQTNYLLPSEKLVQELSKNARRWISQYPNRLVKFLHVNIFQQYDFIGLTERINESLAVMTLLFDLLPTDVIVLSAKKSGRQYDAGGRRKKCTKIRSFRDEFIPKANSSDDKNENYNFGRTVQKYLNSTEHQRYNIDYLLYYAAEMSLNKTIDFIGKDIVHERVQEIQYWSKLINDVCYNTTIFPCSANGTYQEELSKANCYIQDAGCGYPCIDELIYKSS